jgi:hypothetical protein
MTKEITPMTIDGKLFYRPADMAHMTKSSENTIYRLVNHGNCFRKMKCTWAYLDRPLIPASELTAFPFSGAGRYSYKEVRHYDENGNAVECYVCSTEGPGHCPNTKEE